MQVDYNERIPNNVGLADDRRLLRALERWQPAYLDWWRELGPVGALEHDVYLRTAISVERDGWAHFNHVKMPRLQVGHLPGPARARPAHQLRHPQGRACVAGAARGIPCGAAPADRRPGRHGARFGGAATPLRPHRALALRPAQSLPGQCRGGPAPLGNGLPAARLFRTRRARGRRRRCWPATRAMPTSRARWRRSTSRRTTGSRSSCTPSSRIATASSSSARSRNRASIRCPAPAASC